MVIILSSFFISPGILDAANIINNSTNVNKTIVSKFSKNIEISAGSDYYVKFSLDDLKLIGENITSYSFGLSEKIKDAIAKSPQWIQRDLTRQFHNIDGEEYADLILNLSKRYTDEIAFLIASSSLGNVPSAEVLKDNVIHLYENDNLIKYADIVDYDDLQGNYYSTVRYWVLENGTEKQLEYPPEIYYWYIVHPETSSEKAGFTYEKFWRDYLFNHNDLGYPLLKEKLSEIQYLWDCESYFQPAKRLWQWSMENHPTAIEAISYWIGKTVPEQAYGDRPVNPNVIAHEHNGWCGELQTIAVAAQRTSLIPSIGVWNYAEDHVWREFYERGWHENDNWWSDGGGAVDEPDVYTYGWGKDMSAVFAWKGDDSVYEVTSRYFHPEDRKTIKFVVKDRRLQPIDGARITAYTDAPEGMTPTKNRIWDKIEDFWDRIPEWIKGKILQALYDKFKEKYDKIPELVNCVWNYTNMDGECTLELGKNKSYVFVIQHGNLQKPWTLSDNNAIRVMPNPKDKTYYIIYPFLPPKRQKHLNMRMPKGDIFFNITFSSKSYQTHESILWIDDKGVYEHEGKIDFFIVDENNFEKYRNGKIFICHNYMSTSEGNIGIDAREKNWYIVFKNSARNSNVILDFSATVKASSAEDKVQIVSPDTSVFDNPVFNVGDIVTINGVASDDITLYIDGIPHEVTIQNYEWFYEWDTSNFELGDYLITADCGDAQDNILITLVDTFLPIINIDEPSDKEIVYVDEEIIEIAGNSSDNLGVEKVEVSFDDMEWKEATGTEKWFIHWNISEYELGDHIIYARAIDKLGRISYDQIFIVLNESGHGWGPQIYSFYHQPENPTNISNVIIYANVAKGSPFNIHKVVLYWNNGTTTKAKDMFRYADNPVQERHGEDPLINESNDPIYGFELGQFLTGTNITYWIVTYDTANNQDISDKKVIEIENV